MTEIQKTRQKSNPGEWQKGVSLVVSLVLVFSAMLQATLPNHQMGAIACVWLSVIVYLQVFHFSDRRLSKELVQEIDALRRELEQVKKTP